MPTIFTTLLPIPTESAIETAVKNAQRDGGKYRLNDLNAHVGMWLVVRKEDPRRSYLVDLNDGTCDCQAFERSGVCKHQKMVSDEIAIRETEEQIEAREFMLECSREHNVGFTAEVLADTYAGYGA